MVHLVYTGYTLLSFIDMPFLLISWLFFYTFGSIAEKFDANPLCSIDNWGMPLQNPNIQRAAPSYYSEYIQNPCSLQWKITEQAMSDVYPMATAIHSKNTDDYDSFKSIGIFPIAYGVSYVWRY